MASDFENLARNLMGSGKLPQNLDKIKGMLNSEESRKILSPLMNDGGDTVKKVASDIQSGKMDSAKQLINHIMSTPGGAQLVSQIVKAVEEK